LRIKDMESEIGESMRGIVRHVTASFAFFRPPLHHVVEDRHETVRLSGHQRE
jgi:hypothetical protein